MQVAGGEGREDQIEGVAFGNRTTGSSTNNRGTVNYIDIFRIAATPPLQICLKNYMKSIFGSTHEKYKEVTKLIFKNMRKD